MPASHFLASQHHHRMPLCNACNRRHSRQTKCDPRILAAIDAAYKREYDQDMTRPPTYGGRLEDGFRMMENDYDGR